jgi:predicted nucleotidyltransferase
MLDLIRNNLEQIAVICRANKVKRLELFGSAARDDFDFTASDLDFLVEFESYEDPAIADHWFGLEEQLAELLNRKIDLCSLRKATDPLFLDVANQSRIGLYAA